MFSLFELSESGKKRFYEELIKNSKFFEGDFIVTNLIQSVVNLQQNHEQMKNEYEAKLQRVEAKFSKDK